MEDVVVDGVALLPEGVIMGAPPTAAASVKASLLALVQWPGTPQVK